MVWLPGLTEMRAPTALRLVSGSSQLDFEPVAERLVAPRGAGAEIAEEARRRVAVDHDDVEHAVEIEIDDRGAASALLRGDAGLSADLGESPVPSAEQQIVGIVGGEFRHRFHVALGDEEVEQAVIVHVGELAVPAGRGAVVGALIGALRGRADVEGDVLVDRLQAVVALVLLRVELLQLGVAHRGQRVFRIAVAGEIGLGDPHSPDGEMPPAVGGGEELRRAAGIDAPHLLLAAAIILAVVGDAERRRARLVPVGEEHGERAIARREHEGGAVGRRIAGRRADQIIVPAGPPGRARRLPVDVVADGERRELRARFEGGGERRRPFPAAVEGQGVVGLGELAVGAALEEEVRAEPEDKEVHVAVIVDVDRIGADDLFSGRNR